MDSKSKAKQLSTTNLILVVVLICVLVIGIGAYVAKRLTHQIALNQHVISQKSLAASQLTKNLQAAPMLVQSYDGLSGLEQTEIADALPINPDVPGFLAALEHITSISGVQLTTFTPTPPTTTPAVTTSTPSGASTGSVSGNSPVPVQATFTVSGSYQSVVQFLRDMEQSVRPMQLSQLQVAAATSGTNSGSLTVTLDASTYYQAAPSLSLGSEAVK